MVTGLFSTYRQGENRVTSTFLAVLERLSLANIDRIFQAILDDSSFQLVRFENQVKAERSVPDARISANFSLWIETKTARNAADSDRAQLREHLKAVDHGGRLFLLTPDDDAPRLVADFPKEKLIWANFRKLSHAIEEILQDTEDPPNERDAFLLREFVSLLKQDGLLRSPEDLVLVVAARVAWPDYQGFHAYICQPKRSFQPTSRVAFYANGKIQKKVPRVTKVVEQVTLDEAGTEAIGDPELQDLVRSLVERMRDTDLELRLEEGLPDKTAKVLFLTAPDSAETITLGNEIINDLPGPFTYGHRYVSLESLQGNPKATSELLK